MQKLTRSLALIAFAATAAAQIPCYDGNLGTQLSLTDDSFSGLLPLGFSFTYGGASYTDVSVCSNGYIVFGTPVGTADYSPTVAELVGNADPRICPIWCDLNPSTAGSGQVWYNAVPAVGATPAYFSITYDGVYQFGSSTPRSAQVILIDGGSIQVHLGADNAAATNTWLLGASQGNGAVQNPVSFLSLPIITAGNPTLHEDGVGAIGAAGKTMLWLPDGTGGYIVTDNPTCASHSEYGQGCVAAFASWYEHFQTTPSIDLSNTAIKMLSLGAAGYLQLPSSAAFLAPGVNATNLNLSDDSETVVALTTPFPHAGGALSSLNVCSNGRVEAASNSAAFDYTPTVAEFLNWPNTTWSVWRDFIPTPAGADNIYFEEVGSKAVVTWLNVVGYVGTSAGTTPSTFQLQFDTATGDVDFVFQSMDTVSVSGWTGGEGWLVGYSPAGSNGDRGNLDLTAAVPATFQAAGADILPLALAATGLPMPNASVSLDVSNIAPTVTFGGMLIGLTNPNLPLAGIGMPGCTQYADNMIVLLFFPLGSSTASVALNIPNALGLDLRTQAAVFDSVAPQTALGAVASNGVLLHVGN